MHRPARQFEQFHQSRNGCGILNQGFGLRERPPIHSCNCRPYAMARRGGVTERHGGALPPRPRIFFSLSCNNAGASAKQESAVCPNLPVYARFPCFKPVTRAAFRNIGQKQSRLSSASREQGEKQKVRHLPKSEVRSHRPGQRAPHRVCAAVAAPARERPSDGDVRDDRAACASSWRSCPASTSVSAASSFRSPRTEITAPSTTSEDIAAAEAGVDLACKGQGWGGESADRLRDMIARVRRQVGRDVRMIANAAPTRNTPIFLSIC